MFQKNVLLKRHSNYKIGGPAAYFAEPKTAKETIRVLSEWREVSNNFSFEGQRIFILGGGTNILFSDAGFAGLILKPNIPHLKKAGNRIIAGASVSIDKLLAFTIKNSLGGLEWSGGLPGTLGGAVRGNAGCFGGEIKDVVLSVTSISYESGKPKIIIRNNAKCKFGYRDSVFKYNSEIIIEVVLVLKRGDIKKLAKTSEEKKAY
ncbi:MAG: FAD-binding protein, partial [bacterium]|nr:FAD-binding protein [bacterium]